MGWLHYVVSCLVRVSMGWLPPRDRHPLRLAPVCGRIIHHHGCVIKETRKAQQPRGSFIFPFKIQT